jgi:hypothetical protein
LKILPTGFFEERKTKIWCYSKKWGQNVANTSKYPTPITWPCNFLENALKFWPLLATYIWKFLKLYFLKIKNPKLMQLWKMGSKCHKQIEMPQFNHTAIIFSDFSRILKIFGPSSYWNLKISPTRFSFEKEKPKTDAALEQGPKCCKHIKIPQSNHMAIISSNFSRILWNFGP